MKYFKIQRKIFVLTFLLNFFISISKIEAKEIECERISDEYWSSFRNVKTCFMQSTTSIDEPGAAISRNDVSVEGLDFGWNKKIFNLPDNVARTFPNLKGYDARSCSLKEISKQNFNGLVKLKFLSLSGNRIEKIASETFEDLVALEYLLLDHNKIKFMNGEAFLGLNKLKIVWLHYNICIDEDFWDSTQIEAMQQTINEKCSFEEEVTTMASMTQPSLTHQSAAAITQIKVSTVLLAVMFSMNVNFY